MSSLRDRIIIGISEFRGNNQGSDFLNLDREGEWSKVKNALASLKKEGLIFIRRSENGDDPYYSYWALTSQGEGKVKQLKPAVQKVTGSVQKKIVVSVAKKATVQIKTNSAKSSTLKKKRGWLSRLFG